MDRVDDDFDKVEKHVRPSSNRFVVALRVKQFDLCTANFLSGTACCSGWRKRPGHAAVRPAVPLPVLICAAGGRAPVRAAGVPDEH